MANLGCRFAISNLECRIYTLPDSKANIPDSRFINPMSNIAIRVESLCKRYRRLAFYQADRYRCSKPVTTCCGST